MEVEVPDVDHESILKKGAGDEEAKKKVAAAIAKELIEKSKKLASEDVEITVPQEVKEEAKDSNEAASSSTKDQKSEATV
eukprot:11225672-Karenia_brevis.AAC.1